MTEVLYEVQGAVALVTLNRPEARNAVNGAVCDGMRAAIDRAEADPAVRCVVLTGAGKVFCAGMDLKAHLAGETGPVLFGEHGFAGFVARRRTKPVVAAVEGAALAGGFEIMLACDLVIAGESAVFGLPEPTIGLIAGAGGAVRLGRRIPRVLANELLLTGTPIPAAKARDWGLVNAVVADGGARDAALALAGRIAGNAPGALRDTLRLADLAFAEEDAARGWPENDATIRAMADGAEAREGIGAFLEKRPPVWPE